MPRKVCALFLIYIIAAYPTLSLAAAPQIPGFYGKITLPQVAPMQIPQVGGTQINVDTVPSQGILQSDGTMKLTVYQTAPQAIIDWSKFNIGVKAWTYFNQQGNKNWVALNLINDANPTQIFGKLTADGQVYLINQNGILFEQGSQVNVHSLVASSLNIAQSDFLKGVMKFQAAPGTTPGVVSNQGTITTTDNQGSVFLLGSQVENYGSINAPAGQIGLAAGTDIELSSDPTGNRSALIVNVKTNPGSATNGDGGSMTADTGLVGMYGREVTQNGLIRSVTAVMKNGQIELFASDKVTMGANSLTTTPISDSTETVDSSFVFSGGKITVGGLDPAHPANPQIPATEIDLYGSVVAPSGTVTMQADQRIYLESGSSINVGGSWLNASASTNAVSATLNSVTLNNDYGQKGGVLQGQNITVDPVSGSAIGNIQGSLTVSDQTALERSVQGGTINLQVNSGDLIAKQGALLDFSGGGIRYGTGAYATTKLLSGNTVYDISTAPEWLSYSKVLGDQKTSTGHFGQTGEWVGLYFGGGAALLDLQPGFVQGADAGSLSVIAPHVVLDAQLNGSATAGIYQTQMHAVTDSAQPLSVAAGTEMPLGGTLTIGNMPTVSNPSQSDLVVGSIVVAPDAVSGSLTTATPPNPTAPTVLSSRILSSAGLSSLSLYANTEVSIEKGAAISLNQGGNFTVQSRQIEDQGSITIPGGNVSITTYDNVTSFPTIGAVNNPRYQNIAQSLFLDDGSSINVAGLKIDNSATGMALSGSITSGKTTGGSITLEDDTAQGNSSLDSVVVKQGASLDVSGGYIINPQGNVSGGNAGSLFIAAPAVVIDGTMRGLSLPGSQGGGISLQAGTIVVQADTPAPLAGFTAGSTLPTDRVGDLTFGANQLDQTGFSQVQLLSLNALVFQEGKLDSKGSVVPWQFSPSLAKMPEPVIVAGDNSGGNPLSEAYLGATSVTASAGVLFPNAKYNPNAPMPPNSNLTLSSGAGITMPPGGTVALQSIGNMEIDGTINAHSGNVSLSSTGGNIEVTGTGQILAAGYNNPGATAAANGLSANFSPLNGGIVSLAARGSLTFDAQSQVDVSGSAPVINTVRNADGSLSTVTTASDAGSVSLTYGTQLTQNGYLTGLAGLPGTTKGGTLTVFNTGGALDLSADYANWYLQSGFDALTFKSGLAVNLDKAMNLWVGRSLTIDAPVIQGDGSVQVLGSPWITLRNTSTSASSGNPLKGTGQLTLVGGGVDVQGGVQLSGFQTVALSAQQDIRLSASQYGTAGAQIWQGLLGTAGDLTLTADNIYPTTMADFTINAGGKVTTLPGGNPGSGTILSAGGSLTINAAGGIEHDGVIVAPMGQITLNAPNGRVYLADGSVLSTAGTVPVNYGDLNDVFWTYASRTAPSNAANPAVTGAPAKSVTITGNEVITRQGSTIDVSGGGSIFAYQFLPGTQGTTDPFTISGRYVIMPNQSVLLPGPAIYLAGGNGINPGYYSILPEQYAFLPGAMVVTNLGTTYKPGTSQLSPEGYPVIGGFSTVMGTTIGAPQLNSYSVVSAATIMNEGDFSNKMSFTAGDGGAVTINGATSIINGTIMASALPNFTGGTMALSGKNVTVQATDSSLPAGFDFSSAVPAALTGTLELAASAVSGKGLQTLQLGYLDPNLSSTDPKKLSAAQQDSTNTVTIQAGSAIDAASITLSAQDAIVVGQNSQIQAVAGQNGGGTVTFAAPQGTVTIQQNAVVHASNAVTLNAGSIDLQGSITGDPGAALNLASGQISFVPDSYVAGSPGFYITDKLWQGFGNFANVSLKSGSDLVFNGDFNLQVANQLTIDAGRIAGENAVNGTTIKAGVISLMNSGTYAPAAPLTGGPGSISLSANAISVGQGAVRIGGFDQVTLAGTQDFTLKGAGSLQVGKDLNITAARVTTTYASDGSNTASGYVPADFTISAPNGNVTIRNSGATAGSGETPGGILTIAAQGVDQGGIIDLPSGQLTISTGGSGIDNGITLRSGSSILARGSASTIADPNVSNYAPGGTVTLSTVSGALTGETGSVIDVTAVGTGDAGSISLTALQGGVNYSGSILGNASAGKGGSLSVETGTLDVVTGVNQFTSLAGKIAAGGFTGGIDLRAGSGDVLIEAGTTVKADTFSLTADSGSIELDGKIDVSGVQKGGTAAFFAGNNLTLATGSAINASGTGAGASGGNVLLSLAAGSPGIITFASGADINASGGAGGAGGTVTFRAPRNAGNSGVNMSLAGAVTGASSVAAVGVRSYDNDFTSWQSDATAFIANMNTTAVKGSMTLDSGTQFYVMPGVEITSNGDMTSNDFLDLSNIPHVPGNAPGEITLRAAGNLSVNGSIIDNPAASGPTWGINLVAGADLTSADYLAVNHSRTGNLTIGDDTAVFSANAPVRFASGGDTTINSPNMDNSLTDLQTFFNLGSLSGTITGRVGGNLVLNGGAIQTATGDIDIKVGGDLTMSSGTNIYNGTTMGSIRTTGEYQPDPSQYWNYANGGNITLNINGSVNGYVNPSKTSDWDAANDVNGDGSLYKWSASYGGDNNPGGYNQGDNNPTEGIATMAGGNLSIRMGGSFIGQSGTFGTGNLTVYSGGDLNGRFLVNNGAGVLNAMGNIGTPTSPLVLEAFNADYNVSAQGSLLFGTALNPTVVMGPFGNGNWDLQYGLTSSVSLTAVNGDVTVTGTTPYSANLDVNSSTLQQEERVLPPTLEVYAGHDINLQAPSMVLAPSYLGNLLLTAGNDINGTSNQTNRASLIMSDMDPSTVYGSQSPDVLLDLFAKKHSGATPDHYNDPNAIQLKAGGDIKEVQLYLPKQAAITAGGDITDIYYSGENLHVGDVSMIAANGNIFFQSLLSSTGNGNTGIDQAGPGYLLVQAGNSIDLGTTKGIKSNGNVVDGYFDTALGSDGASLIVAAGTNLTLTPEEVKAGITIPDLVDQFFDGIHQIVKNPDGTTKTDTVVQMGLRDYGAVYNQFKSGGETDFANQVLAAEDNAAMNFFYGHPVVTLQTAGAKQPTAIPSLTIGNVTYPSAVMTSPAAVTTTNPNDSRLGDKIDDGKGNISMTESQIATLAGKDDISIFARSQVDVGKSSFTQNTQGTGIYTSAGGAVNVFAGGDVNVNESRLMTFYGGDITVWSDLNINAGRGSRTAVSASPPVLVPTGNGYVLEFKPPAVGSGIRAVTYGSPAPDPGNINLYAPNGNIDAGEAGIAGKNLFIVANQVLNAQNFVSGGNSVGVPATSEGTVSIGALGGAGAMSAASSAIDQNSAVSQAASKFAPSTDLADDFIAKWLDVKVLSFDEDTPEQNKKEKEKEKGE